MFLKPNANLEDFFQRVRSCRQDVMFHSGENDWLNLRSALCVYLFTAAFSGSSLALRGEIVCSCPEDEALLREFLE